MKNYFLFILRLLKKGFHIQVYTCMHYYRFIEYLHTPNCMGSEIFLFFQPYFHVPAFFFNAQVWPVFCTFYLQQFLYIKMYVSFRICIETKIT